MRYGLPIIMCVAGAMVLLPMPGAAGATDPGVSDAGPNSVSLRQLGQGNGQFSPREDLTQRVPWRAVNANQVDPQTGLALTQPFEIRVPGVTAYVQRPTYVVPNLNGGVSTDVSPRQAGGYLQLVGPNAVYSLIPPKAGESPGAASNVPDWHDTRISTRYSTRIGQTFNTRFSTQIYNRMKVDVNLPPVAAELPAGTYVGPAKMADPALKRLVEQLPGVAAGRRSSGRAKAAATQPTQRGTVAGGVHRVGNVPASIRRELHVIDQPHRSDASGDQGHHAAGQ